MKWTTDFEQVKHLRKNCLLDSQYMSPCGRYRHRIQKVVLTSILSGRYRAPNVLHSLYPFQNCCH